MLRQNLDNFDWILVKHVLIFCISISEYSFLDFNIQYTGMNIQIFIFWIFLQKMYLASSCLIRGKLVKHVLKYFTRYFRHIWPKEVKIENLSKNINIWSTLWKHKWCMISWCQHVTTLISSVNFGTSEYVLYICAMCYVLCAIHVLFYILLIHY